MAITDELSSVAGWMSIACWIIVYSPQIYENYTLKSGEGLSVPFVLIWLAGDLCNLVGALMAGLIPTVIILAVYYTLCDLTLLLQIYYYRHVHPTHIAPILPSPSESAPLLSSSTAALPPSSEPKPTTSNTWKKAAVYGLAVVFVVATGLIAWRVSKSAGGGEDSPGSPEDGLDWKTQVIGWCSAILYLGSRIPQILKNRITKCSGLSLALFVFAVAGNVTYVLSICVKSMQWQYLVANSSWLAGSGLTVFLDFIVFGQFFYYRSERLAIVDDPVVEPAEA
ncbi:PQ-loop-domain-containing protein [Calocera viscosa TUFC12733]|uniref:PQ-loop-domain-containing protein n=1 Tax=Calocera viscosa (strain TUFC12733) TaxID=1330018 RepID=A0A167J7J7_CALVF|nr:PQ-loop-domain-containing protein [Calocera viscosa TUFC12733]